MKRRILSSILILVVIAFTGFAQTQQGLVKIKGRYSPSGQVIPGPPLAGVSVKVKGRNAVLSNKNGTFQFPVPSAKFFLERVAFPGHRIADPDKLRTQYSYSKENPLEIAMEDIEQHAKDVEYAVTNIRREMRREIRKREDEIYRLREENKMQEKDFQEQLQKLHADAEKGEKLVMEMAEYFASIDFDKIDDQKREVSALILKGELQKAKAMILRPGRDIEKEIDNVLLKEEFDNKNVKQKEEELAEAKTEAEKTTKQKNNLADELYSLHQVYALEFKNDSAAYYLERRAQLDTLNVDWQLDAGKYITEYLADYNKAMNIFQHTLNVVLSQSSEESMDMAITYNYIAWIFSDLCKYDQALEYYEKDLKITEKLLGSESESLATTYNDIGIVHNNCGNYSEALQYFNKALDICCRLNDNVGLSSSYNSLGRAYHELGEYDKALDFLEKSLKIKIDLYGSIDDDVATSYSNIGCVYYSMSNFEKSLTYALKALDIFEKIYGKVHPRVASVLNDIGICYLEMGNYDKALQHCEDALNMAKSFYGEQHKCIAIYTQNIASIYKAQGYYDKSLEYHEKSLNISRNIIGEISPDVARIYHNIGDVYITQGNNDKALEYFEKAVPIWKEVFGEIHPYLALSYSFIATIYNSQGNFAKALEYYQLQLNITEKVFGEDNYRNAQILESIGYIYGVQENFSIAIEFFEKAIYIGSQSINKVPVTLARAYNNCGTVYSNLENYETAMDYWNKAIKICRDSWGDEDNDLTIGLFKIYCFYPKLISKNPSYKSEYKAFLDDTAFIVTVLPTGAAFKQQGMRGQYYLLEFANWNINTPYCNLDDVIKENQGKPKSILVLKDGVIERHYFEDTIGIQNGLKYVSPEEKANINRLYQEWKSKQQ